MTDMQEDIDNMFDQLQDTNDLLERSRLANFFIHREQKSLALHHDSGILTKKKETKGKEG